MPELPEVETVVLGLAPHLLGAVTKRAWVDWPRILGDRSLKDFNRLVPKQTIEGIHRRGKYICISLSKGFLVIHLRMTGRLYVSRYKRGEDRWVHFSLALDRRRYLVFSDARKFGRVQFAESLAFLEEKLGPEPLTLRPADFAPIFSGSSRVIKSFLLDQKKLAGVGNIYADEALFLSGIHPERAVSSLRDEEKILLGANIQTVLAQAIDHEGATISWYRKPDGSQGESQKHFTVYGRTDQPCGRCGVSIEKIVIGQRGTHFCPQCQR